ncbi:MAG: hypothetical protein QNL12_03265 [Acidimicrobiia bacterium]|nr:hypothetical protein [Acidimicrobiia bacterium]
MTFTYTGRPGTSDAAERRDSVRFLVGDTVEATKELEDEEIAFLLDQEGNNVWGAALRSTTQLQAKYAALASYSVGDLSIQYGTQVDSWAKVAGTIKARRDLDVAQVYAGGISLSDKATVASDTDWNRPDASLGMHDNDGTGETIHGYTT